jgi:ligand-binding SRPBCC domain-containing protein
VLQTRIDAPIERCFDLARSIDFHLTSARSTQEQVIGGVLNGLIGKDEEVKWKAKHFGRWFVMRVRITGFKRPVHFQDKMIDGPFHSFTHDHNFETQGSTTVMTDHIIFRSPTPLVGGLLDRWILGKHLQGFVLDRNRQLKVAAESNAWRQYLRNVQS